VSEFKQIRIDHPKTGQLMQAGFEWEGVIRGRDEFIGNVCACAMYSLLFTGPIFWWSVRQTGPFIKNFWYYAFDLSLPLNLLVIALCVVPLPFGWTQERLGILFTIDDTIIVTWKRCALLPSRRQGSGALRQPMSHINSISHSPIRTNAGWHFKYGGDDGYFAYDVDVTFVSGERICLAHCLDEQRAHIVVAQLQMAKREILLANARAA
jgi:hypothetical protein